MLLNTMRGHRLAKVGVFFFMPFGFANCQLVLYISNVRKHYRPTPPMITQMSIVLGLQMVNRFCILRVQTNKQRKNNMKKYYFSILIQDSETINEIDELREKFAENDDFNICAYVCDMFCGIGFEDDKDNFTDYMPYICKGSDFTVDTYREYTLVRNLAVCGNYMLYREATAEEVEWLEENK